MALRKASAYSKKVARPFTRISRTKSQAYIKTVPQNKIVKYHIGNQKDFKEGKHPFMISFIAEEPAQIRDNALEAARQLITKTLDSDAAGQYYLNVKAFPHHFLRENKTAAGAGADRMSSGMTHSYGIIIGRAAKVNTGQEILTVSCANQKTAQIARNVLSSVKAKMPCKVSILFEKIA